MATIPVTAEITTEISEAIRETVSSVSVNRTRQRPTLSPPEVKRFEEALTPVVLRMLESVAKSVAVATPSTKEAPKWYGKDNKGNTLYEGKTKNEVFTVWTTDKGLDRTKKRSTKWAKGVYFYDIPTGAGFAQLWIVYEDNLDEMPTEDTEVEAIVEATA